MQNYFSAVLKAAELAPGLEKPTEFIKYAEVIADLLTFIYDRDYDQVTEDLVHQTKLSQDYED